MADPDTDATPVDQETLVADIDRTRTELARTIDAISDRVNPRKNVQRAKDRLRERVSQVDPVMAGAAAAAVVVGVTILFLLRRRKPLRRPGPGPPQALAGLAGALGQLLVLGRGQQVGRQGRVPVAVLRHPDPEHPPEPRRARR